MELTVLTKEEWEQCRLCRNENLSIWRTPYLLTKEMQEDSYNNMICNRKANSRYWGVHEIIQEGESDTFIGVVGLTDIFWENRFAELSMMLNINFNQQGLGTKALLRLLDKGFNELNLENIRGEAYTCSITIDFWNKILERTGAYKTYLPNVKYWQSSYYQSLYFNFTKKDFKNYVRSLQ